MSRSTRSKSSRRKKKTRVDHDFVAIAIAYAEDAIDDRYRRKYCRRVRQAAKRFIADLKLAQEKKPPFVFSPSQANQACRFIEQLPHVEGIWSDTNLIRLEPAQIFFVAQLFGFRKHDGTRRFSTALFAVARKNAKSTLAATILIYCLAMEHEEGPQIISAATTGDQARIVFSVAKRMVEKSPPLRSAFQIEPFVHSIVRYENSGSFKPINAKASTQDGLNPSALCFDELHAHKTHDLFNVLRSAAGSRKNPLFLYTTTEGYENPGPWHEERAFACQVLAGVIKADHYLAVIYQLDDEDDDFDEKKWIKANPLLGISVEIEKMREYATEAKQKPGSLAEFRIKRLNRQAAAADVWVNLTKWKRCAGPVPLKELAGSPCWAAFDLASTTDMTAWRLLWRKEGRFYTWGRYWVPSEAAKQRTERGSVPYQAWITAGLITQTDGEVADYGVIRKQIVEDYGRFAPNSIAYDPWNATQLAQELIDDGLPLVPFIQGPKSYHPPMQAFEREYTCGNLNHGGDPVLTWNAANLVPRRDANNNLAPDRKRSADKIDGMVTLLMAWGRALEAPQFEFQELIVV